MTISSLAIIEDDNRIRNYLADQIKHSLAIDRIELFDNAESALISLTSNPVTVALFDVQLPGMSGIACIEQLKVIHPHMEMMVLTVYDDAETIFNALKAGATSYLLKSTPSEKVVEAIEDVCRGGSPISSQIARKVIDAFAAKEKSNKHLESLSRREQEILEWLAKGFRYKEIADRLFLSIDTVRTHVRNIYEKLHVNCRNEALKKTGYL